MCWTNLISFDGNEFESMILIMLDLTDVTGMCFNRPGNSNGVEETSVHTFEIYSWIKVYAVCATFKKTWRGLRNVWKGHVFG